MVILSDGACSENAQEIVANWSRYCVFQSNMEQHMKTLETASNSISANGAPQSSMQTNLNEEEYDSLASMFHYRDRLLMSSTWDMFNELKGQRLNLRCNSA